VSCISVASSFREIPFWLRVSLCSFFIFPLPPEEGEVLLVVEFFFRSLIFFFFGGDRVSGVPQ